jgi:hypothetical protein
MPQRELRWHTAAPVLEDMKIRMAGASSADLNQDLSWTGYGGRYIDHLRRTASANKSYRFHRISNARYLGDCNDPATMTRPLIKHDIPQEPLPTRGVEIIGELKWNSAVLKVFGNFTHEGRAYSSRVY